MTATVARRSAFVIAVLMVVGCRGGGAEKSATTAPVQLGPENVATVVAGSVESGPLVSGTLAPVRVAQIRAQVAGPVLGIFAQQGEHVTADQVLARIDATAIRDTYASAKAALASAQVAADFADRQAARYDTLFKAGAVSPRDHENAREQQLSAQATLENARAQLASAQKELAYTEIRSPFAGVVSDRTVNGGDIVQVGTALYTVVDPSRLQLQAAVPAEQISSVRIGAPVSFTLNGYPGRTFTGHVTRINPVADPSTRQVQVYAEIPNPGNTLVGGLFATGRVVTERDSGLVLPSAAIDTRNLRPAVERMRSGVVQHEDVVLGLRDARTDRVRLVAGVALGDTVLLGAAQGLTAGTRVTVVANPSDAPAAARPSP